MYTTTPLLPCPFCASAVELEDCRTVWIVRCRCGASMLGARAPEPETEMPAAEYWARFRRSAIAAWNRRAEHATGADAQHQQYRATMWRFAPGVWFAIAVPVDDRRRDPIDGRPYSAGYSTHFFGETEAAALEAMGRALPEAEWLGATRPPSHGPRIKPSTPDTGDLEP